MLKRRDLIEKIEDFGLVLSEVGEEIKVGSQHHVFRYGEDRVIKIPRDTFRTHLTGRFSPSTVRRHIDLVNQYFPDFKVDTDVMSDKNGDDYIIVQQYVPGEDYLSRVNIKNVAAQFDELLKINETLVEKEKKSVDMFGFHGFEVTLGSLITGKPEVGILSNLMLMKTSDGQKLKIIDTNLSDLMKDSSNTYLRVGLDRFSAYISRWLLKKIV